MERITYNGWPNCLRLHNNEVELIASTDVGPRILAFQYIGEDNLFYLTPEDAGRTGGDQWRLYGGHRLWHAPENIPLTYHPDNVPVQYSGDGRRLILTQAMEPATGLVKEIEIIMPASGTSVQVYHRLINRGDAPSSLAPWGITMLAPGGLAIIPQEPFGEEDDFLLPARTLVLWQYAQMNDPRWTWGNRFILAQQDPACPKAQKIGVLNTQGWAAYALNGRVFIKRFGYRPDQSYPDMHCNNELYFNGRFLEIESLAPVFPIAPGGQVEHCEQWSLVRMQLEKDEERIAGQLLPVIHVLPPFSR